MMKKIVSLILCLVLLNVFTLSAYASNVDYNAEANEIISHKIDQSGTLKKFLCDNVGIHSEWYVIALHQLGQTEEFEAYSTSLAAYLSKNKLLGTNAQRCAIGFLAANCKSTYIDITAEDTIGTQGIMSYIWGLHLLNNGAKSTKFTKESLAQKIASFSIESGGFALSGTSANIDVTAMAICALSPYYESLPEVKEVIDLSLAFISSAQTENGGFINYGVENSESVAQVIIALCSLGIDPTADERFIKNGNSAVDSLLSYKLESSGYSHATSEVENEIATEQALLAFVALARLESGKGALFILDEQGDNTPKNFKDVSFENSDDNVDTQPVNIKNIVSIAIIAVCAVGIGIVLLIPKKKTTE